jgi:uncharacterized protein YneF (UPF0154 family)
MVEIKATVHTQSRTEASYGKSTVGNRIVSMDFNAYTDKNNPNYVARGVEVVIPNNATDEEKRIASSYVKKVKELMDSNGYAEKSGTGKDYPIRQNGIGYASTSEYGRGKEGFFHLEPFFAQDKAAVEIINNNKYKYAEIIASTFGQLKGARIIPPHEEGGNEGATAMFNGKKMSETDFAREEIVPQIQAIASGDPFGRAKFKKQLDENPQLKEDLIALTYAEVGGTSQEAQQALIESLFNRTNAYGAESFKNLMNSAYYEPMRTNTFESKRKELEKNPTYRKNIEEALVKVLNGSNVSNFSTHNASGNTAKNAESTVHVRKKISYGTGTETFYTKTKDDPTSRNVHGSLIDKEIAWLKSVGAGIGSGETSDLYPTLTQYSQELKGVASGELVNLVANMFPGIISNAIAGSLPSSIANLPSASTISSGLVESIRSGQGFVPFTSAVEKIASAETPVGRLTSIGDVAQQYETEIKALVPSLSGIDFKSAIPAIIDIAGQESPSQRLVSGLRMMETMDPDKLMTVGDVLKNNTMFIEGNYGVENLKDQPLSTLFDVNKLSDQGKTTFASFKDIPISTFEVNPESAAAKLGLLGKALYGSKEDQAKALEYLTKGQLPDIPGLEESFPTLLSGSLEDIVKSPLTTNLLGEEYSGLASTVLTGEKSVVTETLTNLGASKLSEFTELSEGGSKTLLAGGSKEEIKKMRQEVGGMALDEFITSNPTLAGIINWFSENQQIITLLGSAGAVAGLSALLGGGTFGGLAAGAGSIAALRFFMGKEGFEELQGFMKEATAPMFDFMSNIIESSGLGDIPIVGSFAKGATNIGRENPLATLTALTGNISGAAGIMAATGGIDIFEGDTSVTSMLENLQSFNINTQVSSDSAVVGLTNPNELRTTPYNKDGESGDLSGEAGVPKTTSPFEILTDTTYQDFGATGIGNIVGGAT